MSFGSSFWMKSGLKTSGSRCWKNISGFTEVKSIFISPSVMVPPSCPKMTLRFSSVAASGSGNVAASTSFRTRDGCRSASSCAIMPPIESPSTSVRSIFR